MMVTRRRLVFKWGTFIVPECFYIFNCIFASGVSFLGIDVSRWELYKTVYSAEAEHSKTHREGSCRSMERGISGKLREFSPSCPVQTQLRFQSRRITKRMRNEEAVYSRKINWTEMPTVDALQNNWQEPLRAKFFSVCIPPSPAVVSRYDMLPRQFWIRPPPFRCHCPPNTLPLLADSYSLECLRKMGEELFTISGLEYTK